MAQWPGALGMGQSTVELRKAVGADWRPEMTIGTERKVYRQHRGWQAFLEAPASPREAISPYKMATNDPQGRVYGTSSTIVTNPCQYQQTKRTPVKVPHYQGAEL